MDLTWLALSVGALAMLVVAYLAWHIGKQDADTPQLNAIADYEVGNKTFVKPELQITSFEFLTDRNCTVGFFAP
jgi:hypothetical protein